MRKIKKAAPLEGAALPPIAGISFLTFNEFLTVCKSVKDAVGDAGKNVLIATVLI